MSNIVKLIREDLKDFAPYASARLENDVGKIQLNANELPWPQQLASADIILNRYPDQQPAQLKQALADFYHVSTEQLLMTRGSDEGIDLLIRLCCNCRQDSILICPPTFGMYEVCAKLQGASVLKVPLIAEKNYTLPLADIENTITPHTKLIFLCSPNNPTGNLLDTDTIITLCKRYAQQSLIVIDEAYIEFSDDISSTTLLKQHDNLVILRTLSKAFGLAAARLGIVIAHPEIIAWLQKILSPYPLTAPTIAAALHALTPASLANMRHYIDIIKQQRTWLTEQLQQLPSVTQLWPSQANFILVQFKQDVESKCLQQGIILRNMSKRLCLPHMMRISIGTPEENSELINFLKMVI